MTFPEIQHRIEFMRSLDREHVHLPIATVEKLMATAIGKVEKKALEKGKIKPVDKTPKPLRKGKKAKAERIEKALKANREGKR